MAEIAPLNLTTVPFNPRLSLPEEDMSTTIRKNRESALKNTLAKFQILTEKENFRNLQLQKKTDAFVNAHGELLFSNKANALDPNSFLFSSPEGRKDLLKQWRTEVGGNYAGFNAFLEMGSQGENRSALRNLHAAKENFRSDKKYRTWVNETLRDLSDEDRERLFSMLGDDVYGQVSDLYDVDYGWQGLGRELQDVWEDNPLMIGAGAAALGVGTTLLGARAIKARRLARLLTKSEKKTRKRRRKKGPGPIKPPGEGLVPVGGPYGPAGVGPAGVGPQMKLPGSKLPVHVGSPAEAARRAKARAAGLDPSKEIFPASGVAVTPMNKVNVLRKEWSDAVRTGALTQSEAKAFNKALDSVLQKGDPVHFQTLLPALRKQQGAGNLIRKWGNGIWKWGALPLGGLMAGEAIGEGTGSIFGEKAGEIGGVVGGTAGLLGANMVWNTVSDVIKKKGLPWAMKRIVSRGGPTLALKILGKGALGTIGGLFSGGLATALSLGLLMSDLYLIYDILQEE